MANHISMRKGLDTDPRMVRLVQEAGISIDAVIGKIYRLWCWADGQAKDGMVPLATTQFVDDLLHGDGFAMCLERAGLLQAHEHGVSFPGMPVRPKRRPTDTRCKLDPQQEQMFDAFWTAYPRRKDKPDARRAWVSLLPTRQLLAVIVAAIDRQRRSPQWRKDGGQFIPYPATWLRARGWEDEDEPLPPPPVEGGPPGEKPSSPLGQRMRQLEERDG